MKWLNVKTSQDKRIRLLFWSEGRNTVERLSHRCEFCFCSFACDSDKTRNHSEQKHAFLYFSVTTPHRKSSHCAFLFLFVVKQHLRRVWRHWVFTHRNHSETAYEKIFCDNSSQKPLRNCIWEAFLWVSLAGLPVSGNYDTFLTKTSLPLEYTRFLPLVKIKVYHACFAFSH